MSHPAEGISSDTMSLVTARVPQVMHRMRANSDTLPLELKKSRKNPRDAKNPR